VTTDMSFVIYRSRQQTHHISRVGLLAHIGTLVYNVFLSSYPTQTNKENALLIFNVLYTRENV